MRLSLETSLQRLQTTYIDLFYVHWWDYTVSIPELMHSLNDLVASGKVNYLGIATRPPGSSPRPTNTHAIAAYDNLPSTKANGTPQSATSSAKSIPCAVTRAWAYVPMER